MSHYKPYPAYKDSEVDWLGRVPEHWNLTRVSDHYLLRNGFPFNSAGFCPDGDKGDRLLRIRDLSPSNNWIYTSEPCPQSARVTDGDVLVGMDGEFNAVLWEAGPAKLNQRVCALRGATKDQTKFLLYLLPLPLQIINDTAYSTTVKHLSSGEVLSTRIALPPPFELQKIVAHLDREIVRIDGLVSKKTRFIELLREKRQALITHAVTKGLDPSVSMKDSGVEWLGEVPEHWDVVQLRHKAKLESGHTPSRSHPEYWIDCDTPWFTLADVWQVRSGESKFVYDTSEKVSQLGLEKSSARLLPAGSVFLSRTASVGFSGIMGVDMATSQDFAVWTCDNSLHNEFLYYILRGMKGEFDRLMMGSTHKTIYMPDIEALRVARPPLEEQKLIVEFLSVQFQALSKIIDKSELSLSLLKERRSALITAAVTGQIDLRETV